MSERRAIAIFGILAAGVLAAGCGGDSTSGADDGATDHGGGDADADADADVGADADADVGPDAEATADDGGGTGVLVVTVVGPRLCPDWVRHPVSGAAVAFDAPGGARTEGTTDDAGQITFDGIDWSAGTGAVTAWHEGYCIGSTLGVDGSTGAVDVILPVASIVSTDCVNLSGTAQHMANEAHYLGIGALAVPEFRENVGPAWSLQVPPGVPLTLVAVELYSIRLADPRDFQTTPAWTTVDHAAVTVDTTVDTVDLSAAVTPTTVHGSCALPARADSPLRELSLQGTVYASADDGTGQTYPMSHGLIGMVTDSVRAADGNTIDWGIEHLTPSGVTAPVTMFELFSWTSDSSLRSDAYLTGYPAAGAQTFTFLDAAQMTAPPDSTTHQPLHDPVQWTPFATGVRPWLILYRGIDSNAGVVWVIRMPLDVTSAVVPEPPSAAPVATLLGTTSIRGYLRLVDDTPDGTNFFRTSSSAHFVLDVH